MRRILTAAAAVNDGDIPQTVTVDGHTYPLSWHDEFDGSSFNPNLWVLAENNVTGYPGGGALYDPHINPPYVSGGVAHFPVKLQNGKWYFSGIQGFNEVTSVAYNSTSVNSFIEIRAKCGYGIASPSNPNKTGIWSGIWQMPIVRQPGWNGADASRTDFYWLSGSNYQWWPYCGEIDLTEHHWEAGSVFGNHMSTATYIHAVNYAHGSRSMGDMDQCPKVVGAPRFGLVDWTGWHTYSLHRYAEDGTVHMKIRYDGVVVNYACGGSFTGDDVWDYSYADFNFVSQYHRVAHAAGRVWGDGPAGSPFTRPFYTILHGCAGSLWNENGFTINPANSGQEPLLVDYVRAYQ